MNMHMYVHMHMYMHVHMYMYMFLPPTAHRVIISLLSSHVAEVDGSSTKMTLANPFIH